MISSLRSLRISTGLALAALCACSPNLRPAPASLKTVNLGGTWMLAQAQSDNVEAELRLALQTAAAKQAKKRRRGGGPMGDPQGDTQGERAGGPGGAPPNSPEGGPVFDDAPPEEPWWQRQQRRQEDEFIRSVTPPGELRIAQNAGRVELTSAAGGARRSFDPTRPSTLVTEYATLRIYSGWEGNTFVVHSADAGAKMEIVERYSLTAAGELVQQLTIELPQMKTQSYRAVYRRATSS